MRDRLLNIEAHDVDVCAALGVAELEDRLRGSEFRLSDRSMRLGTVHISCEAGSVEFTSFRQDSYREGSGEHAPVSVAFTNDITTDAKRRDFKCNAVYFDLCDKKIVDPLGGVEDIKNRRISLTSSDCFEADGLRILRMIRFASELGFEIEESTFESAKLNAWRVKDIAIERIRDELDRIFVADVRHKELNLFGAHVKGFRLLDELGFVKTFLPEVDALRGIEQPKQYHLYDAFEHSVHAFEAAKPNVRWAALLHDIGKAPLVRQFGYMHGHAELGAEMAKDILRRLRFKTAEIKRICELIACHMVDINGNMSFEKLKLFALKHIDIMDDLILLMEADAVGAMGKPFEGNRVADAYAALKASGVPLKIKDLKIGGEELIALGVKESERGKLLSDLLADTALNPQLNSKERAFEYAKKRAAKLK